MKTQTININGTDFTIEQLNFLIENSKKDNPMDEVFKFHKMTEEEFGETYKNIPKHLKSYEKECLIVSYYNKNQKPDWKNSSQYKYYPYFVMDSEGFRYYDYYTYDTLSHVPARLCFLNKADMIEATEKFKEIYKESRLG